MCLEILFLAPPPTLCSARPRSLALPVPRDTFNRQGDGANHGQDTAIRPHSPYVSRGEGALSCHRTHNPTRDNEAKVTRSHHRRGAIDGFQIGPAEPLEGEPCLLYTSDAPDVPRRVHLGRLSKLKRENKGSIITRWRDNY